MKKITFIILSLLCINCYAEEITCYSYGGQVIYKHKVHDVRTSEGFYVFKELPSGKIVYIASDCVVKFSRHK